MKELSKIHCLVLVDPNSDDEPEVYHDEPRFQPRTGSLAEGVARLTQAERLAGHNIIGFDLPALQKVLGVTLPGAVDDTLVWSRLCYSDRKEQDFQLHRRGKIQPQFIGQHTLGSWGDRLGERKAEYKGGFAEFNQEMLDYCIQDVKTNRVLYRHLLDLLPDWRSSDGKATADIESLFAQFCNELETNGVPLDHEAADRLLGILLTRRAELDDELHKVFPPTKQFYKVNSRTGKRKTVVDPETGEKRDYKLIPFNPGSRPQLANRLIEKYGWVPENFTKTGDPVMAEEVLLSIADIYPEAKIAAERFVVQARIGILEEGRGSYLHLCDADGNLRGRFIHIGTVTHRCAHRSPNLGNPTSINKPYGRDIRKLFVAMPGYVFAGGDAAGLELRMLGHYLARYDGGRYADIVDTGDPHTAHMRAINTVPGLEVDRTKTKTLGYGWLYGAGDEKLGRVVGRNAKVGRQIRNALRSKIEGMDPLLSALEMAVKKRGYLLSLDGRRVGIRKTHAALNTLLQSAGAVVMRWFPVYLRDELAKAGVRWGRDYIPHLHVHDELQGSLRPDLTDVFRVSFENAFARTRDALGLRVPLRCEVKFGSNWAETH